MKDKVGDWGIMVVHKNNKEIGKLTFRELLRLIAKNLEVKKEVKEDER